MKNKLATFCRILAAVIMLQTLYFKFSGAAESVYIFSTVGMEPWGRIGVGVAELIAAALLLYKPLSWLGAALGLALMGGAIGMHVTLLGIEIMDDGGYLFFLAVTVAICSAWVLYVDKDKILRFIKERQLSV